MSLLSMLQNAKVQDIDAVKVGDVIGISIIGGHLTLTVACMLDDEAPEDPEREDVPDEVVPSKVVAIGAVG